MDPLAAIASIMAIVQTLSSSYNAIKQLKGLPKAFKEVGQQLPLVKETLDIVRQQIQASSLPDATRKAMDPSIRECQGNINALNDIFQDIEKKNDKKTTEWAALVNTYRTMLLRLGKAHRVETLMQSMLNSLKALAIHQLFMVATKAQVGKLEAAIRELSEVEPSLPDSDFEAGTSNFGQSIGSGGSGNMFNAVGGPMTNKFGNEFNATGNMSFGTDFMNALMKNTK